MELIVSEPFDMVRVVVAPHSLTLSKVKLLGVNTHRWVLVNIQDSVEFASHRLNRDTWSDPDIKAIIQKSFLFWQRYHDSAEGKQYCTYYPPAQIHPHIGIIDPRTGQLMKHWSNFVEPRDLLAECTVV